VLTRDLKNPRLVHPVGEHSDIALDANGDDIYVSVDYQSDKGVVFMRNLRTGVRTDLFPTYLQHTATAMHFSGRSFRRPGWVLISTYKEDGAWQWLHAKIFAVELKASPRIVNIAHHHSSYEDYINEPHASVNRDFTRIAFNSNWDTKSKTDVDAYVIELPKDFLPQPAGKPLSRGQ
jgi:hypothetical protein